MIKQIHETHSNNFDIYLFENTNNKDFEVEVFSSEAGFYEDDMFFLVSGSCKPKNLSDKNASLESL